MSNMLSKEIVPSKASKADFEQPRPILCPIYQLPDTVGNILLYPVITTLELSFSVSALDYLRSTDC